MEWVRRSRSRATSNDSVLKIVFLHVAVAVDSTTGANKMIYRFLSFLIGNYPTTDGRTTDMHCVHMPIFRFLPIFFGWTTWATCYMRHASPLFISFCLTLWFCERNKMKPASRFPCYSRRLVPTPTQSEFHRRWHGTYVAFAMQIEAFEWAR